MYVKNCKVYVHFIICKAKLLAYSSRVLAFCVGGPGFKPRLGHTKDFLKMLPNGLRGRIWEVTLRRTGVPSKGEHCSQSLHATETGVKHLPYGPFGSVNPVDQRLYLKQSCSRGNRSCTCYANRCI